MLSSLIAPSAVDRWIALTDEPLPVGVIYDWCLLPSCGAVVLFSGIVRNHAEGRDGVSHLDYEAYEEQVLPRIEAIADQMRGRWPSTGRVAILHRLGRLELTESSVVVAASAAHRAEAFEAARYGIDTLKVSVPIWKRESWEGGQDWATGSHPIGEVTP